MGLISAAFFQRLSESPFRKNWAETEQSLTGDRLDAVDLARVGLAISRTEELELILDGDVLDESPARSVVGEDLLFLRLTPGDPLHIVRRGSLPLIFSEDVDYR